MTDEERREMMRNNYAAQMEMLGYDNSGNPIDTARKAKQMRSIDANVLLEKMKVRQWYVGRASDPVCLVEDAPTVDVESVKHGKWKYVGSLYDDNHHECAQYNCSECGLSQTFIDVPAYYSFCPMCGAKMDDGEDS